MGSHLGHGQFVLVKCFLHIQFNIINNSEVSRAQSYTQISTRDPEVRSYRPICVNRTRPSPPLVMADVSLALVLAAVKKLTRWKLNKEQTNQRNPRTRGENI